MENIKVEKTKNCIHLTGYVDTWEQVVEAGLKNAKKGSKTHVVNDIKVIHEGRALLPPKTICPSLKDTKLEGRKPDVLIIGGGIVGCAIARELTKNKLDVLLVEKEYDVALHASSRNDGMIHPGIDIPVGMLKKKFNNMGNSMYERICTELDIPFDRTGQYLCFKNGKLAPLLWIASIYWKLTAAGGCKFVGNKKLHEKEPFTSKEAKCALFFDGAGMVCPYNLTIAYAENAMENGAEISLNTAVSDMEVIEMKNGEKHINKVMTNRGNIYPKVIINAAGVFSEEIATMAQDRFFSIHPRKGTNAILDKKARKYINTIYSLMGTQSKSYHTKGGGIVGTVDGNVLIGPDAVETMEKENFATKRESIDGSFEKHKNAGNWLTENDIITYFTGVRAATYEEDFIIENGRFTDNIIHAAGIQSPGLTAAPAIALEIERLTKDKLSKSIEIKKNETYNKNRKGIVRCKELSLEERNKLIRENPDYGEILCRCEEISKGEIIDAMRRPLPCDTVDGIKRRVRPGMGRCQGGFCGQLVLKLIAKEKNISVENVRKGYEESNILMGEKGVHSD